MMAQILILLTIFYVFTDFLLISAQLTCGSTQYHVFNRVCCCMENDSGEHVCRSHARERGMGCCGIEARDSEKGEYCCGVKLRQVCRRPIEPTRMEWCGIQKIDITKELCCNGVRRNLNDGMLCCNTRNYNPARKICCDGELLPVDTGHYCCGNKNFGPFYQCCNAFTGKIRVRGLSCSRI